MPKNNVSLKSGIGGMILLKKALCSATLAKGTQVKYPALPTTVTVLIFSETHKIRSPEAMTRLMNLLIPDSWKNMRRA